MKAVIMAGGQGSRLRPLTSNLPKPMIPVVNRPIMEHIVLLLRKHGLTEQVATVQFLGRMIQSYFGDGSDLDVTLEYAVEEQPLGTAGSVRNAYDLLKDDTFLVISGDALTDIDLTALLKWHREKGAAATLCLKSVPNPLEFGVVITEDDGKITRFLEKPDWGQVFSDTINTGIYVLEPEVLDLIPAGENMDFSSEVFPMMMEKGMPLYGYVAPDGYWCDVGNPDAYLTAHRDVLDGKVDVEIGGYKLRPDVWVGEGSEVDPSAKIVGPAVIGENTRVGADAKISAYSCLGSDVFVSERASIHRSIVGDHAWIGGGAVLRGCVIGKSTDVRNGARVNEGAIVGDDCSIGESAVLQPGITVYPFKTVEDGAIVNSSIVWEAKGVRTVFGSGGVSGLLNVDVTPEVAVRVAMAYASSLPRGARVVTSRDPSRAARAVKRALMAGLNLAGVDAEDLELAPEPVARHYIKTRGHEGGAVVRSSPKDPETVTIGFLSPSGTDIDASTRRKLERAYYREEYRRAHALEVGAITYPPRPTDYYVQGLLRNIDIEAIRGRRFKVVTDLANGSVVTTLPSVFGRLSCEALMVNNAISEDRTLGIDDDREARVASLVEGSNADLGLIFDETGSGLQIIGPSGRLVPPWAWQMLATSMLHEPTVVALTVSTSRVVATHAEKLGHEVRWIACDDSVLQGIVEDGGAELASRHDGMIVFSGMAPAQDGIYGTVKLLDLLTRSDASLDDLTSDFDPPTVITESIPCPWELKGAVMRFVMEESGSDDVQTTDGVKAFTGDDWVLTLPDPERPFVHLYAEAGTEVRSRNLLQSHVRAVRTVVG